MAEKSIVFKKDHTVPGSEFELCMVFCVTYDNSEQVEVNLPIKDVDDLENNMELFFNKEWKKLFIDIGYEIVECEFEGIHMKGLTDKGRFSTYFTKNYTKNTVIVNEKLIKDLSAEKLLKIRDIILSKD